MRRIIGAAGAFLLVLAGLVLAPSVATAVGSPAPTTTKLTVSPTTASTGDNVQFAVEVTAEGGARPSGTLNVWISGWGTSSANVFDGTGKSTLTVGTVWPQIPPGSYTATATFLSNDGFATSESQSVAFTVLGQRASTNTALSLSPNPSTVGRATQLVTAVSPTVSGQVPTGTVLLTANGHALAEVPLHNGAATYSFVPQTAGTYVITASYLGDEASAPSSAVGTLVVSPQPAATTTTVTGPASTAIAGTPVALSATVSSEAGTPSGTVTFFDGQAPLGTVPLVNGTAQTTATFAPGTHPISAAYSGSEGYASSTAAEPFPVTVSAPAVPTVTSLTGSPDTAEQGDPVELTASVSALRPALARAADPEPTGTVEFFEGSASLGTAALADGTASLTLSNLAPGTHRIAARYTGADGFEASESEDPFTVTITARPQSIPSRTTVSASPDRVEAGSEVALVADVSGQPAERAAGVSAGASDAPAPTPTGSVEFFADGTSIGTAPLSSGAGTLTVSSLAVGSHRITAAYRGDGVFAPSETEQASTVVVTAKPDAKPTPSPKPTPTARPTPTSTGGKSPAGSHLAATGAAPAGPVMLGGVVLLGVGLGLVLLRSRRVRPGR